MNAVEYLLIRLDGEDGEAPWSLKQGAKECTKKLKVAISEQMLSKWRTNEVRERRAEADVASMIEGSIRTLAQQAESGVPLEELVDAQIVQTIGKVYVEDGVDAALEVIKAFTSLKRSITADRDSRQGVRAYEESTANLRATIDRLTLELKVRGYDPAALDELNKQVVGEVDKMILANKGR